MRSVCRSVVSLLPVLSVLLSCASWSWAATTIYTNESDWLDAVYHVQHLATDQTGLSLSDEVNTPLSDGMGLSQTLTFSKANTGLNHSFTITAMQADAEMIFNDVMGSNPPVITDALSVGKINQHEDDDWQVTFMPHSNVTAFALNLLSNNSNPGESLTVFGHDGSVLAQLPLIPRTSAAAGVSFLGVTSDTPIKSIVFNEDTGDDDIEISHFRLASIHAPEPASLVLLSLGLAAGGARRWRRC